MPKSLMEISVRLKTLNINSMTWEHYVRIIVVNYL